MTMGGVDWAFQGEMIGRLAIAALLGGIIGFDRSYRAKDAGLRTYFLVSLGSALMMIVSQYGFEGFDRYAAARGLHENLDPSRVASSIVSGIGFLGAGMIIFQKRVLSGLTSAAGLWASTGIGMAVGGGLYLLGIAGTVFVLIGFELLKVEGSILLELNNWQVTCILHNREELRYLLEEFHTKGIRVLECHRKDTDNGVNVKIDLRGNSRDLNEKVIMAMLRTAANVKIEKQD